MPWSRTDFIAGVLAGRFGVDTSDAEGCWLWRGPVHVSGVVRVRDGGKDCTLPRVAWALYHGSPPPRHRRVWHLRDCVGARCCQPAHLTLRRPKRRAAASHGKLARRQVRRLRARYAGGATLAELARTYRINPATVLRAVRGQTYRAVK